MANKRILKKQIKYACGDLAGECVLATYYVDGIDVDKMQEIVFDIAELQTKTLKRVTFSYDKVAKDFETRQQYSIARAKYFKQAYNALRSEFDKSVLDIVKSMNAQLPQAQKDANKKALN